MHWESLTVDEFAEYRREEGMKLVKLDGIWWAEVRPFFFRPLFPFREIQPWSKRYPPKAFLGGFLHVVPSSTITKSCINFHVYDNLQNYSIDTLSSKRRKVIRHCNTKFSIRPIPDLEEFVSTAYPVYKIFYERTNYWYKNERNEREHFLAWATKLYDYPKINKNGVYLNNKLSAVETSFRIEDIIFGDNLFADNEGLKNDIIDFLVHSVREAAADTDAKYFFSGLPTGVTTLDSSKRMRGCKLLSLPAYCKINPFALTLAKLLMKDSYHKLLTVTAQEDPEPEPCCAIDTTSRGAGEGESGS
jgi:hypothetical protein